MGLISLQVAGDAMCLQDITKGNTLRKENTLKNRVRLRTQTWEPLRCNTECAGNPHPFKSTTAVCLLKFQEK